MRLMYSTVMLGLSAAAALGVATAVGAWAPGGEDRPATETSQIFEFALLGDMPYGQLSLHQFDMIVDEINADQTIRWVLHAGDIKSGSEPCTDALLRDRYERFQRFERPFILTPGDNEWTDCHRDKAGGYEPLERLEALRRLFFPRPGYSLGGAPMAVETQAADPAFAGFPENVRWGHGNVIFATVHLVGSFNGTLRFAGRSAADDAEVAQRTAAALAWLQETFAVASEHDSLGVFVMLHANPHFEKSAGSRAREPYQSFINALEREVTRFGRPVLIAHGDTHRFRYDQPLRSPQSGAVIDNLRRVETFGGIQMHWVRISVDPDDPQVFRVQPEVSTYDPDREDM